ncbi:MAG: 23S rRNA (uracil(1939)-C(5))-methyltransferase RlmD [Chloroflexota bacterium]
MTQPNPKNEVTLEIDRLSYGPYGIGRVEGRVLMVPHSAPGDTIVARVVEERERFSIGQLVRVLKPSPQRRTPPCPYVGACGGCAWQHLSYEAQLQAKAQSIDDALRRIGKLADFDLRPIIPADGEFHYRRRIRLQIGPANRLGFYGSSSHQLVEIDSCLIADERLNHVIETVRRWAGSLLTPMEHLEIVVGDEAEQLVVAVGAAAPFMPRDQSACESLIEDNEGIQGLIVTGRDWRKSWGQAAITVRTPGELALSVDANVFTQVNPKGNLLMLEALLDAGQFHRDEKLLELFCGAGNFTLSLARRSQAIVAVEGHRPAVSSAKLNAQKNGIDNIRWICAPVPRAVAEFKKRHERFAKIVLDPPRSGAKGIETDLAALGAEKIFYISCNPATLARDLAALSNLGYKIRTVQPIDLFPQTFHVEALTVLER